MERQKQDKKSVLPCLGREVRSVHCWRGRDALSEVRGQALESFLISRLVWGEFLHCLLVQQKPGSWTASISASSLTMQLWDCSHTLPLAFFGFWVQTQVLMFAQKCFPSQLVYLVTYSTVCFSSRALHPFCTSAAQHFQGIMSSLTPGSCYSVPLVPGRPQELDPVVDLVANIVFSLLASNTS